MNINALDPTQTTSMQFLDFGSVYSADGREHPILGMTPVYAQNSSQDASSQPTSSTGTDPASTSLGVVSGASGVLQMQMPSASSWNLFSFPPHFGARVAVGIIAIAIILIVIARMVLK